MKLLKQEPDEYIQATVDFMMKVDTNFRKEIRSHARFLYHEYQDELKQKEIQHLHLVKSGGKA
ncbi:hypothetical protein [Lactococcus lactis]|uniref:hypothetical protein n=1 Tax=Lactococcus lactis TaxID=1358 RepID=UPI000513258E|nr:hypothetical protein [Lactococcus lactis]KGF77081.1 hypothetical protein Llab_1088 [Lactococcus lactis]